MNKKTIILLSSLLVILTLLSGDIFTNNLTASNHENKSSEKPVANFSISTFSEEPNSLKISFPQNIRAGNFVWIDKNSLYIPSSDENTSGYVLDIQTRNISPALSLPQNWIDIYYEDDTILFSLQDGTIQKYNNHLELKEAISFSTEFISLYSTIHIPQRSLYFLKSNTAGTSTSVWCEQNGSTYKLIDLPALPEDEFYFNLQVSPSGKYLFLFHSIYEMGNVKGIYLLDLKTLSLSNILPSNSSLSYPSGYWVDNSPIFFTRSETQEIISSEILLGDPLAVQLTITAPFESNASFQHNLRTAWGCFSYEQQESNADASFTSLFYIHDKQYFSYDIQSELDTLIYSAQMSPDMQYVAFYSLPLSLDNETCNLYVIDTSNSWKPFDWMSLQKDIKKNNTQ